MSSHNTFCLTYHDDIFSPRNWSRWDQLLGANLQFCVLPKNVGIQSGIHIAVLHIFNVAFLVGLGLQRHLPSVSGENILFCALLSSVDSCNMWILLHYVSFCLISYVHIWYFEHGFERAPVFRKRVYLHRKLCMNVFVIPGLCCGNSVYTPVALGWSYKICVFIRQFSVHHYCPAPSRCASVLQRLALGGIRNFR